MKTDMELLSAVVHDRLQELNLYRTFVAKKGLTEEFAYLLESAKAVSEKARGGEVKSKSIASFLQQKQQAK
ncbi:hypothetical protein ACIQ2D_21545 [Lysinibacillus sp. NPDC097287]|uniref:hypothetical protein n=1 Tax=Lysinibacillus sp. NPDC097287 TaxID=3364144 RepID=UPI00380847D8